MAVPLHIVNIYEKPKLGTAFIKHFPAYNYRHEINAMGGFDTAQFDIALRSLDEMQQFLDQYIGNRIAIYVDNPVEPVWEGFINRMTFSAGSVQYTISLDEMANRVTVTFTNPATSATAAQITGNANNADSQAVYGIKWANVDFGQMRTGADAVRNTILAQRAWPKSSITRGNGNGLLHVECLGFYHTLGWEVYANTATTNIQTGLLVSAIQTASVNGTTFFNNADTTDIATNTTTFNQEHIKRETNWDSLMRCAELGDGTNYFVVGITPTLFATGTRRLYYRAANTDIEYTARLSDGLRIRDLHGKLVPPWMVRPDRGIRVSDMLIGWNGLGDDPTETWIKSISYDANSQRVDYQGDDDTTAEGAFQLNRYGKPIGKRWGAGKRVV